MPEQPPQASDPADLTALAPLKVMAFRMLWGTWLVANTCMWMSDVAAAWMMTSMTTTPLWVALVQTAATLPVFLLGLPSGALADILDRRRYFIMTQFWIAGVATLLCIAVIADVMTPALLLALTFANGVGLAMRWPVFAAIVPELVPRAQLPAALALNGISMNASRIIGPLLAGALIASAGTQYVFVLNAVLSVISGFVIMRWRRAHTPSPLGRERLLSAMRVGMQFVAQSSRMRATLTQVALFFLHSTALLALLPLIARGLPGGGAGTFTLLLASMGAGAIGAAFAMPRLRQMMPRDTLVLRATLLQSVATVAMAIAPNVWVAVLAMLVNGMAWITCANSLSVSAQLALPDWVQASSMGWVWKPSCFIAATKSCAALMMICAITSPTKWKRKALISVATPMCRKLFAPVMACALHSPMAKPMVPARSCSPRGAFPMWWVWVWKMSASSPPRIMPFQSTNIRKPKCPRFMPWAM